jgi:hypothetical protein
MLTGEIIRRVVRVLLAASLALVTGCVPPGTVAPSSPPASPVPPPASPPSPPPPEKFVEAFTRLNRVFQVEYERILSERGSRTMRTRPEDAFSALHAALVRLGMIVESRDPDSGTLTVAAPAPRPLSAEEWRSTVEADAPMMGAILCPVLGPYCRTLKFEPDDYVIVINATVLAMANGGCEVALTTRMREIAPRPGMPRREYPPPTGVRMALDKIWAGFDREIAEQRRRAPR